MHFVCASPKRKKINMDHPGAGPTILIAPLDWGLGHATRCIPIIKNLLAKNCKVIIAASGKVKALLEAEFTQVTFIHLPGYNIQYASTRWGMPFKIVAQIPKLFSAINKEQQWLHKVVAEYKIDAVISDNRYGLYHSKIVSVFITHQLTIKAPHAAIEKLLQRFSYRYINRFSFCWVPDMEGLTNLSGALAHPAKKPTVTLRYIGPLSRFQQKDRSIEKHLLILLSGPEPQRTVLEKKLWEEVKEYSGKVVFVRGLPDVAVIPSSSPNIEVHNHLTSNELQEKISDASFVISRCGYSTIMDLAALQKRAVLISTPGQTEQEYLAKHLMKNNFALCISQKKFRLKAALGLASTFNYQFLPPHSGNLEEAIEALLKKIIGRKI